MYMFNLLWQWWKTLYDTYVKQATALLQVNILHLNIS